MNKKVIRFLLFFLIIIGLGIALAYRDSVSGEMLEEGVRRFGEMGPLFFIGVYAVGTAVFLPGSIMTLAGGAMFGPVWGVLYSLTGATIGAIIVFLCLMFLQ